MQNRYGLNYLCGSRKQKFINLLEKGDPVKLNLSNEIISDEDIFSLDFFNKSFTNNNHKTSYFKILPKNFQN